MIGGEVYVLNTLATTFAAMIVEGPGVMVFDEKGLIHKDIISNLPAAYACSCRWLVSTF
jgi:hypothetical protein